jgi:hypothetical protein
MDDVIEDEERARATAAARQRRFKERRRRGLVCVTIEVDPGGRAVTCAGGWGGRLLGQPTDERKRGQLANTAS